jgi:hypothetical protein
MTAIDELKVDRSDQTAFLHHVLKGGANDDFFAEITNRNPLPMLGEAFDTLEKRFETHEKQSSRCAKI